MVKTKKYEGIREYYGDYWKVLKDHTKKGYTPSLTLTISVFLLATILLPGYYLIKAPIKTALTLSILMLILIAINLAVILIQNWHTLTVSPQNVPQTLKRTVIGYGVFGFIFQLNAVFLIMLDMRSGGKEAKRQ